MTQLHGLAAEIALARVEALVARFEKFPPRLKADIPVELVRAALTGPHREVEK